MKWILFANTLINLAQVTRHYRENLTIIFETDSEVVLSFDVKSKKEGMACSCKILEFIGDSHTTVLDLSEYSYHPKKDKI